LWMLLVQLHIAPQNPKTPFELIKVNRYFHNVVQEHRRLL